MRNSYDQAFELTVGLEGHISDNPSDPGGFTVYGLSSRFNPGVHRDMTLNEAKNLYLVRYWVPAGCDDQPFPMDICLFDSQVNPQNDPKLPGGGNKEILSLNPENWQEYNLLRMARYMRCSKPEFVKGHIFRIIKLSERINELQRFGGKS